MLVPTSAVGKVAALLFALCLLALNPPVVTVVGSWSSVAGFAPLYLWFVCWGVMVTLVLVWAAHRDAFGLTEAQVPPEFERTDETSPGPDGASGDSGAD